MTSYKNGSGKTYEAFVKSKNKQSEKADYRSFIQGITGKEIQTYKEYAPENIEKITARYNFQRDNLNKRVAEKIKNGEDFFKTSKNNSLDPLSVPKKSENNSLNPLKDNDKASNKRGVGEILKDFFIGGTDEDGNDKFFKLFGVDVKTPESIIKANENQKAKEKAVSDAISKNGLLDKGATKEESKDYYTNIMKDMGYSDEEIDKALGFGGQVSSNTGFLGKVNSAIRNSVAPGSDTALQMIVNENERNKGSKIGNFASSLIGNTAGLAMNPGGGMTPGKNLLNVADDLAEGVANKLIPSTGNIAKNISNRALRGAVDGAAGGVLDSMRGNDMDNLGSNVAAGVLGGGLMFGGGKAIGEIGDVVGKNIDSKFNTLFDGMNDVVKATDTDGFTKYDVRNTPNVNSAKIRNTNLENAYREYNEAVEAIQNYAGHYKLTDDEMLNAMDDLGIDIFEIVNRINKLENSKIDVKGLSEYNRLGRVAGVKDAVDTSYIQPLNRGNSYVIPEIKTPFAKASEVVNEVEPAVTPRVEFERTNVDVGRNLGDIEGVGDRGIRLLSNEMGELRPYIVEEAETTLRELNDVVKGERFAHYDNVTGENITTGTKKQVSPTIQAIQDLLPKVTYDKIRKGLQDIIEGKDTSIAKKIELILDDNLSNGRLSGNEGIEFPANADYLEIKNIYKQMNEGDFSYFQPREGTINVEAMNTKTPRIDNSIRVEDQSLNEAAATVENMGKPSKFANDTVFNSENADDILKEGIENQNITYDPITNRETLENAQTFIDSDFNKAMGLVMDENRKVDANTMAIGQDLVRRLQNEGRYDEAINVLERLTREGTQAGQAIQALSMWKRLTPDGMLAYAQRQINKVNDGLPEGAKKVTLDETDIKGITDRMGKVQELPDGREKDILLAEVNKIISNKIPAKFMDKLDSFRYINMLFNPKTLIKNAAGNVINTTMGNIRDVVATPIDMIASKFTGDRTVSIPNLMEQGKGIVNGVKTVADDYRRGIDTTGGVKEGSKIGSFKEGSLLGGIERLLSTGLKMGDIPFYEAAKNNYLSNIMKLNGVDVPTNKMLEDAHQVGLEATFQQRTGLSDAISGLKNSKSNVVSTAAKTLLPFSQTPSAILDTSVNYTPLGVARGAYNLAKGNQRQGVNQLASGLLGSGLMAGGYALADNGGMTGQLSSDSETAALQKQAGMQPYALKMGNDYYSIDFAQPAASPLMTGADIAQGNLNPLETAVNSILENSYLSGLQNLGDAISKDGFGAIPKELVKSYASQLLPFSALSGQVTRTLDPAIRDTYSKNEFEREVNKAKAKYPGLAQTLPQGVDTVGEDKVYNEGAGLGERALRNFILPFNTTTYQPNDIEEKALDIYNDTGETIQMPRYAPDTISYGKGKEYELTAEERREYNKYIAKALRNSSADALEMQKAMTKAAREFKNDLIYRHNLR